jgi:hypothetical protein
MADPRLTTPNSQVRYQKDVAKEGHPGATLYVRPDGNNDSDGLSWFAAKATITGALSAASAGDRIIVAPGDYDETVTITKDNITIIGAGPRASVAIAPTTTNANAIVVDGTTAGGRVEEVYLVNLNGDADGTGAGLYLKGNIRRFRAQGCKFEAADTTGKAVRLDNTSGVSVGDVILRDCEICWAQTGVSIEISAGGEQTTQLWIEDCLFHNLTANHIINATGSTAGVGIHGCRFLTLDDGTAPTGTYVDLRAGTTTGLISGCYFPAAINGGKVLVDTGVVVVGCYFTGGINTTAPS